MLATSCTRSPNVVARASAVPAWASVTDRDPHSFSFREGVRAVPFPHRRVSDLPTSLGFRVVCRIDFRRVCGSGPEFERHASGARCNRREVR